METVQSINQQLIDLYGIDTVTGQPIWRVSWSDDQLEKRRMDVTPSGMNLIHPHVFEVPKYPFIRERYVLERLVIVPEINQNELPDVKLSYEPIWVFQSAAGEFLPPIMVATKYIVDTVYAALGKQSMAKYLEVENREQQINELQQELFGNETETSDALGYGEGIVVPPNYVKES